MSKEMDFLQLMSTSPKRMLETYLACLAMFDELDYDDPYVLEIRLEAEKLMAQQANGELERDGNQMVLTAP